MSLSATEPQAVFPPSAKPAGPYSPGILAGDYLYVSGQGARDEHGILAPTVQAQTRQCMLKVKSIVEAAGLTMDHVVFVHVYLSNLSAYEAMNKEYASFFSGPLPPMATIFTAAMPQETPVEISAVAVRDLSWKKPVTGGIFTRDRFYVSSILGYDLGRKVLPDTPEGQVEAMLLQSASTLRAAHIEPTSMGFVTVYHTSTIPAELIYAEVSKRFPAAAISIVPVTALASGAQVGLTGIAAVNTTDLRGFSIPGERNPPCVRIGDTFFCTGFATQKDDIESQTEEILTNLRGRLRYAGGDLSRAVSTNVYLDDIADFAKMNQAYAAFFPGVPPSRTTVQPALKGALAGRVSINVIAVRDPHSPHR